jgi:hypothetical protein
MTTQEAPTMTQTTNTVTITYLTRRNNTYIRTFDSLDAALAWARRSGHYRRRAIPVYVHAFPELGGTLGRDGVYRHAGPRHLSVAAQETMLGV